MTSSRYLVGRSGTDGLSIDINIRLLSQIEPDDGSVLGVDIATDFLQSSLKTSQGGLAAAVDLEAGHPPEVGAARDGVGELLNLVEMIQHADRSLHVPHGGGLSCPGGEDRLRPGMSSLSSLCLTIFPLSASHRPRSILTRYLETADCSAEIRIYCYRWTLLPLNIYKLSAKKMSS